MSSQVIVGKILQGLRLEKPHAAQKAARVSALIQKPRVARNFIIVFQEQVPGNGFCLLLLHEVGPSLDDIGDDECRVWRAARERRRIWGPWHEKR